MRGRTLNRPVTPTYVVLYAEYGDQGRCLSLIDISVIHPIPSRFDNIPYICPMSEHTEKNGSAKKAVSSAKDDGVHPLHEQIRLWIEQHIASGRFAVNEKLPSEHELCEQFSVSRVTVRRALQTLEAQKVIYRCQGVGSFVGSRRAGQPLVRLTDFMEDMERAGVKATSRVVDLVVEAAHGDVADRLGVREGQKVVRLDRLRLGDARPVAFDMTWMPILYWQLLEGLDLGNRTLFSILEGEFGVSIQSGTVQITAISSDERMGGLLEIPTGQPLLQFNRTAYTLGEKPVYWQKRFYRPDKVSYEIRLERGQGEGRRDADSFGDSPVREIGPVFTR